MDFPTQPPSRSEQGIANTLGATLAHRLERDEPSYHPPTGRDAHPKHHGCVKATFTVEAHLASSLQRGVCARPGRSFEAWIRFSNAFKRRHDLTWDARGMAIKLLNVAEGSTQDFLLVTHHAFFARTAADFVDFPATVLGVSNFLGLIRRLRSYFFVGPPSRWRIRGLIAMFRSFRWIQNPLGVAYFSQVPYRLGEHAVKFCVRPQEPSRNLHHPRFALMVLAYLAANMLSLGRIRLVRWENLLHTALVTRLRERDARFDFLVQIGDASMPVDDAVVGWDERRSPYVKVATITIHRLPAGFDVEEMMQFGEHLSFSPWHTLDAHEPLGSINAARRDVYRRISTLRHRLNRRDAREPLAGETAAEYLRSTAEPASATARSTPLASGRLQDGAVS
jgi:hypothetical protein